MANNVINIDVNKVNEAGRTIIEQGTNMYNALEDIKDIINNTKNCFLSDAGDAVRNSFNSSAEKFNEYKDFILKYGEFLLSYGEAHEKVNRELSDLANKIPKL